jgi:hypothetical protein
MTKKGVKMTKKSEKIQEKSALRMPGFNAEASLYTSSAAYHLSGASGGRSGGAELAFFQSCRTICDGDPDCMQCCLCVRRGGHPSSCCF